jgi:serine/threonine-protein kinase
MRPERWREVETLFQAARELEPGGRAAFLNQACGSDVALRHEVESLLRADADASGFMESPGAATAGGASEEANPRLSGAGLTEHLQAALGNRYTIERELVGGGMSRVFVAQETALGRRVVVKVLPPGLPAGLDAERFHREIQVAASLRHPHVVPLHSAGQAQGLLYYTMPFVEGESLRQRLERQGALPVVEAVRVLREITDALCYAHRRGIIHRDLKPANILLEEGHALVTDFGIAKALFSATGGAAPPAGLTSTGLVLGTPAYMAPEQGAGDQIDHRADLYALGCLAYELLTGQPPFVGASAQALIAAHVADPPKPMTSHRQGIPRELNRLVMRLLHKRPADRPQSAEEVLRDLEILSVPARTVPLLGVLGSYLACSLGVLGLAYLSMVRLGLPDWVVPSAVVLLLIGLPIIVATSVLQGRRVATGRGGSRTANRRPKHWLTWRRAISGGVLAFTALAVVTTGYMAMRALGIGPVGTLLAAGVLKERERVLLADFENRTRDSLLGNLVTEAIRIDLTQSPVIRLVPTEQVAEVLARMRLQDGQEFNQKLAREVAVRDNIRVVITGEIATAGTQYVLSTLLISPGTGEVLTAQRETAADSTEIIDAVDRLSRNLRSKIGESLKFLRAEQPLAQVTTSSLEALRKYTQANRVSLSLGWGGSERVIPLLEDAIALDSGFASAYRRLGSILYFANIISGAKRERAIWAFTQAFAHRSRLPERERYLMEANYFHLVNYVPEKAAAAYRAVLDIYPDDGLALSNLGGLYLELRQDAPAAEIFQRVIALPEPTSQDYVNLAHAQVGLGRWRDAERVMERAAALFPNDPWVEYHAVSVASSHGDYASAETHARTIRDRDGNSLLSRSLAGHALAELAVLQGRLREAESHARAWMEADVEGDDPVGYLNGATFLATMDVRFRNAPTRALERVEQALGRHPLDSLKPLDRPYLELASVYAVAGRPRRARVMLAEYERAVAPAMRIEVESDRHALLGELALAEGRPHDAVAEFRLAERLGLWCKVCGLAGLGRAYAAAGEPDSSIAAYERYVGMRYKDRLTWDAMELAGVYRHLGELYQAGGDRKKAALYYTRFVELWKNCDQDLKPQVGQVQRRLIALSEEVPRPG